MNYNELNEAVSHSHANSRKFVESFLSRINPNEILDKIRKFRSLNFQNMSYHELEKAISNVLMWEDIFCYIPNICSYPTNTSFYRVRKLKGTNIPFENFKNYNDFWEPPSSCVTNLGRLNKAGESLLYVTPMDPTVPLKEMRITEGDNYVLIKYTSVNEIKVNIIGGEYNYEKLGITDDVAILNNNLLNDFLRDEFSRDVGRGTEYLYKISEIIAKWYFDLPPSDVQDAWAYSSVHDKSKLNVCFRPELAHKLLHLHGGLICKKDGSDQIKVYCIAVCSGKGDIISYYHIGSEQQKRLFPEIFC